MANHKSAIKRIRQTETARLRNKLQHKTARNSIKKLKESSKKDAKKMLPGVLSMIDKLAKNNTKIANNYDEFKSMIDGGGFVLAHWDGTDHTEQKIKKETKATIRCIDDTFSDQGICIISGKKSKQLVYFAKAY